MATLEKTLYRIPKKGQIFGVCAGLAEYFAMDVTILRVIFIILTFATGGTMILIYIIMAAILPVSLNGAIAKDVKVDSDNSIGEKVQKLGQEIHESKVINRARNYLGVSLLVLGIWLLSDQIFPGWFIIRWDYIWPIIIIVIGFVIITRSNYDGR